MAYEYKKGARVRTLAQGAADSFATTRLTADYQTLAAALADVANWDVLQVYPGTYDYDTYTTTVADRAIVGTTAGETFLTILRTTNVVNGASIFTVAHAGWTFSNLVLMGGDSNTTCNLINATGFTVTLDQVLTEFQGTHECRLLGAFVAGHCRFDCYSSSGGSIRLDNWSWFYDCKFWEYLDGGSPIYLDGASGAGVWVDIYSCYFDQGDPIELTATATNATINILGTQFYTTGHSILIGDGNLCMDGCLLYGTNVTATHANAAIVMRGTDQADTRYVDAVGAYWDVQADVQVTAAATPYACRAFVSHVFCNLAGALVINLPSAAKRGTWELLVIDLSGAAGVNNITVTPNGAETINGAAASYVISDNYGWVKLVRNPAATGWLIVSSSSGSVGGLNVRILAGSGNLNANDEHITVTATGTLTLPAVPTLGRTIEVARRYVGLDYTIDGNGNNIVGNGTFILNANFQGVSLTWDGVEWTAV